MESLATRNNALTLKCAAVQRGPRFLNLLGRTAWMGRIGEWAATTRIRKPADTFHSVAVPYCSGEFTSPNGGVRPPLRI